MTVEQELQNKLDELEETKSKLLRIEPFLNPNNNLYVYSTEDIRDISGTQGVTPSNMAHVLETVVKKINEYTEYIKKLPFVEASTIYRERPEAELAIVSEERAGFSVPITWEEKASSVPISSIYGYLGMGTYYGKVKNIRFFANPSLRKGSENGRDIDIEVKMFRINSRANIKEEYRSGSGQLDVTISENVISPDDMYIIGLSIKESVSTDIIYYQDFTYSIEYEFIDGSISKNVYTIANRKIGNFLIDGDTTLSLGSLLYWDMIMMSSIDFTIKDSMGYSITPNVISSGQLTYGLYDGNILSNISIGMFSTDVEIFMLSYRNKCSWLRIEYNDMYTLYDKNESPVAGIVFKNLIPIDTVLEEVVNAI